MFYFNKFKILSSNVYDCAISSEASVRNFNSQASYCIPLRNEEHKSLFVIELTTKGKINHYYHICSNILAKMYSTVSILYLKA